MNKTLETMMMEIAEYYEAAGFTDFYERKLKHMPEEEILTLHKETFEETE